jgi:putative copper resistance protein D
MLPLLVLDSAILWVHLFCAVLFVGGSFFMWLVVMPGSHLLTKDESERTQMVGKIAKGFGRITNPILVILVLTGIYNAFWYLPNLNELFNTIGGEILFAKTIVVVALLVLIYSHNVYFGRKIVQFAREKKLDELKAIRKKSRIVSFTNLALMVVILILAVMLQTTP